jgi:hypothetical protein
VSVALESRFFVMESDLQLHEAAVNPEKSLKTKLWSTLYNWAIQ